MFPDDDSSFDKEFFDGFNGNAKRGYCYLTDVKDPKGSGKYFVKINKKAFATSSPKTGYLKRNLWNCVGAVNMLLDYNTFLNVGRFDERMGGRGRIRCRVKIRTIFGAVWWVGRISVRSGFIQLSSLG